MSETKHYKSIIKDMVLYGIFGVSSQLATILLLPLFTRLLTTEEYGTLDLVLVSSGLASILMNLNVSSALYRYFYDCNPLERRQLTSTLFAVVVLLCVSLGIILYFLTPTILLWTVKNEFYVRYFRLGWIAAALMAVVAFVSDILRIERRIVSLGAVNLTLLMTQIGISWTLVAHYHLGIFGILISMVSSTAVALIMGLTLTHRQLTASFSSTHFYQYLTYSLPLVPSVLTNWVNQRSTRFIILSFLSLKAVGIYGVGALLASAMSFLVSTFQNAWSAYVMTIFRDESIEMIHKRTLTFYLGGCFILGLTYLTLSKEICLFFLDPKYLEALSLLPWIMGGIILHGTGNVTGYGIIFAEKTSKYSLAAWLGAGFNIILSFFLVPVIGSTGAAIGFFCAEGVFTVFLMKYTYRLHTLRFQHKNLAVLVSIYILSSSLLTWLIAHSDGFLVRYTVGIASVLLLLSQLEIDQFLKNFVKTRLGVKAWA